MGTEKLEERWIMTLQTRVNKEQDASIRAAVQTDRMQVTAWIREVLIAVSRMDPEARRRLVELKAGATG